jgi:hypothetical protein
VSSTSIPGDLIEAKCICVRHDRQRPPLVQLYEGPYAVVSLGSKTFRLQMVCKEFMVSLDLGLASLRVVILISEAAPQRPNCPLTLHGC